MAWIWLHVIFFQKKGKEVGRCIIYAGEINQAPCIQRLCQLLGRANTPPLRTNMATMPLAAFAALLLGNLSKPNMQRMRSVQPGRSISLTRLAHEHAAHEICISLHECALLATATLSCTRHSKKYMGKLELWQAFCPWRTLVCSKLRPTQQRPRLRPATEGCRRAAKDTASKQCFCSLLAARPGLAAILS